MLVVTTQIYPSVWEGEIGLFGNIHDLPNIGYPTLFSCPRLLKGSLYTFLALRSFCCAHAQSRRPQGVTLEHQVLLN